MPGGCLADVWSAGAVFAIGRAKITNEWKSEKGVKNDS
jgi:hypothetical protein